MSSSFKEMGLSEQMSARLDALGFKEPRPIQVEAIPPMLRGENVVGQAQTGSGKTLAFALPILEKVNAAEKSPQALILAPTRELALQISQVFWDVRPEEMGVRVVPIYGGAPKDDQRLSMKQGAQVVVATPGRFIDFLWEGEMKIDKIKIVILDEADRMLEMGFIDDVKFILSCLPKSMQMGLFSATMPPIIKEIIKTNVPEHTTIRLEKLESDRPKIKQICCNVQPHEKPRVMAEIIRALTGSTLIFCRTRGGVDRLVSQLSRMGLHVAALHGGKSQGERDFVMRKFRTDRLPVLIATDIASRGLDIEAVEQVINYDVPDESEDYTHRIGRTGRAGREGTAITLVAPGDRKNVKEIEKRLKTQFSFTAPAELQRMLRGRATA